MTDDERPSNVTSIDAARPPRADQFGVPITRCVECERTIEGDDWIGVIGVGHFCEEKCVDAHAARAERSERMRERLAFLTSERVRVLCGLVLLSAGATLVARNVLLGVPLVALGAGLVGSAT